MQNDLMKIHDLMEKVSAESNSPNHDQWKEDFMELYRLILGEGESFNQTILAARLGISSSNVTRFLKATPKYSNPFMMPIIEFEFNNGQNREQVEERLSALFRTKRAGNAIDEYNKEKERKENQEYFLALDTERFAIESSIVDSVEKLIGKNDNDYERMCNLPENLFLPQEIWNSEDEPENIIVLKLYDQGCIFKQIICFYINRYGIMGMYLDSDDLMYEITKLQTYIRCLRYNKEMVVCICTDDAYIYEMLVKSEYIDTKNNIVIFDYKKNTLSIRCSYNEEYFSILKRLFCIDVNENIK